MLKKTGSLGGIFLLYLCFIYFSFHFAIYRVCYLCIIICVMFDWLIDFLLFYVPLKNISLIWRRLHCRWKFRPTLRAQGLWAGRDLYRTTPLVTRDLGFSALIRRTASFSRLLQHAWGYGGRILTRILTGRVMSVFIDGLKHSVSCYWWYYPIGFLYLVG
jgi:hypothetical protein